MKFVNENKKQKKFKFCQHHVFCKKKRVVLMNYVHMMEFINMFSTCTSSSNSDAQAAAAACGLDFFLIMYSLKKTVFRHIHGI